VTGAGAGLTAAGLVLAVVLWQVLTGYAAGTASEEPVAGRPLDAYELGFAPSLDALAPDRPYLRSLLLLQEIVDAGAPVADPQGAPETVRWDVPGGYNGTPGTWELAVNEPRRTACHAAFTAPAGPVRFDVAEPGPPAGGLLVYDPRGQGFEFRATEPVTGAAMELAFGSMSLRADRPGARLLGVRGYHPDASWLNGSLGSPTSTSARLRARLDRPPPPGVALRLVPAGDLTTIRDARTGWVRVGRTGVPTGTQFVEFATGCLAELANGDLIAVWLRPQ